MKKNISHNSLFMIELIISIFFFIICASICVQAFVKAHLLTKRTENMNQAFAICQNLSSMFYQNDDIYSQYDCEAHFNLTKQIYREYDCSEQFTSESFLTEQNAQYLILLYDSDWKPCTNLQNAFYFAVCEYTYDDTFCYESIIIGTDFPNFYTDSDSNAHLSIKIPNQDSIIYTLNLKVFHGGQV